MKFKIKKGSHTLSLNGKIYKAGDIVDLPKEEGEKLSYLLKKLSQKEETKEAKGKK